MNFYGTATAFRAYHTARGRDVSDMSDTEIETVLLVASEWIDGSFRDRFAGYKVGERSQVREWPRNSVVDRDGYHVSPSTVPTEIENATYEAAYREAQTSGTLLGDYTPNKYESVSIDGALAVKYRALDAATVQTQFPIIGQILDTLLGSWGASSALSSSAVRV